MGWSFFFFVRIIVGITVVEDFTMHRGNRLFSYLRLRVI